MTRICAWACALVVCVVGAAEAATLTIGTPIAGSFAPFGGTLDTDRFPGTRYQQIWSSDAFPAGPLAITAISFSRFSPGDLRPADFELYLTTSPTAVNGIDNTTPAYDANLGSDAMLFASGRLSGRAPAVLRFTGSGGPFSYDPAEGNLLMDIRFSDVGQVPVPLANYQVGQSSQPPLYSRYYDFGLGFDNLGLIATFEYEDGVQVVPLPPAAMLMLGAFGVLATLRRRA